jgi:hypothetical protein
MKQDDEHDSNGSQALDIGAKFPVLGCRSGFVS